MSVYKFDSPKARVQSPPSLVAHDDEDEDEYEYEYQDEDDDDMSDQFDRSWDDEDKEKKHPEIPTHDFSIAKSENHHPYTLNLSWDITQNTFDDKKAPKINFNPDIAKGIFKVDTHKNPDAFAFHEKRHKLIDITKATPRAICLESVYNPTNFTVGIRLRENKDDNKPSSGIEAAANKQMFVTTSQTKHITMVEPFLAIIPPHNNHVFSPSELLYDGTTVLRSEFAQKMLGCGPTEVIKGAVKKDPSNKKFYLVKEKSSFFNFVKNTKVYRRLEDGTYEYNVNKDGFVSITVPIFEKAKEKLFFFYRNSIPSIDLTRMCFELVKINESGSEHDHTKKLTVQAKLTMVMAFPIGEKDTAKKAL